MVQTRSRTSPFIVILMTFGVVMAVGTVWKELDKGNRLPGIDQIVTPASDAPQSPRHPDKIVLDVKWLDHNDGGTGEATFNLGPQGEQSEELFLGRSGETSRSVSDPLGQGAADYSVLAWQPKNGFLQCTITYFSPEGLEYLVAYSHTNFGGKRMDTQANILCQTSPAGIKAAVAKGKHK